MHEFEHSYERVSSVLFLKELKGLGITKVAKGRRQFNEAKDGSSEAFEINGLHFMSEDEKVLITAAFSEAVEKEVKKKKPEKILEDISKGVYDVQQNLDNKDRYYITMPGAKDIIENAETCTFNF